MPESTIRRQWVQTSAGKQLVHPETEVAAIVDLFTALNAFVQSEDLVDRVDLDDKVAAGIVLGFALDETATVGPLKADGEPDSVNAVSGVIMLAPADENDLVWVISQAGQYFGIPASGLTEQQVDGRVEMKLEEVLNQLAVEIGLASGELSVGVFGDFSALITKLQGEGRLPV